MKILKKLLFTIFLLPLLPLFGIPEGAAPAEPPKETPPKEASPEEPPKTHTQADVDKAVKERLKREKENHAKAIDELKKKITPPDPNNPETPPETSTQSDPIAQQAQTMLAAANQRLVEATATTEAVKLGADPKYVTDVVKLADMSKIEVKEDGTIDAAAIAKAIDDVLKRIPNFKTSQDAQGGFKVGGVAQQPPNTNGWNSQTTPPQGAKKWNKFK